jgi:endogenous inhibitor of DNA gyrase (YacG/DUF329 family)
MPYDDEADRDDREYPGPEDDDETVPCPYCGAEVYEDAERCPHCESYISREDAPARKPWWIAWGVFVCLLIVLGWIFFGC